MSWTLTFECGAAEAEFISADLWEAGAMGVQEEDLPGARVLLRAWFEERIELPERFVKFSADWAEEADRDWVAEFKKSWQPIEVGERWFLVPEWDATPTPMGRLRLHVHPGLALGTGEHPATRLCLVAMERHLHAGDSVLDVGTGSGILCEAALLLGASRAVGCDIEEEAVRWGAGHLRADGVPALLLAGSTRTLGDKCASFLVANINDTTHVNLASEYARLCTGTLVCSGFGERDQVKVESALLRHGFRKTDTLTEDHWLCLVFHKAGETSSR